jgi:hypothetical protein
MRPIIKYAKLLLSHENNGYLRPKVWTLCDIKLMGRQPLVYVDIILGTNENTKTERKHRDSR